MSYITNTLSNLLDQTAFLNLTVGNYVMIAVACVFLYLAIKHGFEPLLLVPIAFGMLLVNIYPDIMAQPYTDANGIEHAGGLLHYFYFLTVFWFNFCNYFTLFCLLFTGFSQNVSGFPYFSQGLLCCGTPSQFFRCNWRPFLRADFFQQCQSI